MGAKLSFVILLVATMFSLPAEGKAVVGAMFPEIQLKHLNKPDRFSSSRLRGKVTLVDIWASDCPPCRESLPALNELYRRYHAQGFELVGISVYEDVPASLDFLKEFPVDYILLDDSKHEFVKSLGVKQMPTSYLLNPEGRVELITRGFKPKDLKVIEETINRLLKKAPPPKRPTRS